MESLTSLKFCKTFLPTCISNAEKELTNLNHDEETKNKIQNYITILLKLQIEVNELHAFYCSKTAL